MNRRDLLLMGQNACVIAPNQAEIYAERIGASANLKNYIADKMFELCVKGIYSKLDAMYLLIGGTPGTVRQEYFSDTRNLQFVSSNGVLGTGNLDFSNGLKGDGQFCADTNYTAPKKSNAGTTEVNQTHFILSDEGSSSGCVYGNHDSAYNADYFRLFNDQIWVKKSFESRLLKVPETSSKVGVYTVSNENNKIIIYKNGQVYTERDHNPNYQASFENYYLLAEKNDALANGRYLSDAEIQFWGTSKQLNLLQIQQLHSALTDIQIYLNRKTW